MGRLITFWGDQWQTALTRQQNRETVKKALMVATVCVMLFTGLAQFVAVAPAQARAAVAQAKTPHKGDPKAGAAPTLHAPPLPKGPAYTASATPQPINRLGTDQMKPMTIALDSLKDAHATSSDGLLEVLVPGGAVNTDDIAAVGGAMNLSISEIAPPSGGSAGGGGLVTFGTYLVQVVDGKGNLVGHGLRKAATLTIHYGSPTLPLDFDHSFVVVNGSIPKMAQVGARGPYSTQAATHDPAAHTLSIAWGLDASLTATPATPVASGTPAATRTSTPTAAPASTPTVAPTAHPTEAGSATPTAQPTVTKTAPTNTPTQMHHTGALAALGKSYPPSTLTWCTYTYVAKYGAPSPLGVYLNAGGLTEGIQLDVPPGPGGTLPNVTLAYNSASVSEQHSPQGAAGWAGEGWNMNLGEISWAQHNVQQNAGGSQWQDSWQLVDPFGTSDNLIPPSTNFSTYYDATPNSPNNTVAQWHTADESHIKIYSMNSGLSIGMPISPPCFRVFEQNGVMEEYGCTLNSLQYYYVPGKGMYIANWFIDMISSPTGNQVHIDYAADTATITYNGTKYSYPRDLTINTITYDDPTCLSATTRCTSWHPQYDLLFGSSTNPHRLVNTPSGCNTGTNLRCDDPLDLSGSGGLGAPQEQSTKTLNDITVKVYTNSTWNNLRNYAFTYEQSGPTTVTDSVTGKSKSTAGRLLLRSLVEQGTDGSTAYPTTSFGYTPVDEYYTDSTFYPYSVGYCGPTWNRGHGGGTDCSLWSQTYEGNRYYLSTVDNGEGMQQTIQWDLARNNTHGVPTGQDPSNPFYCTHTDSNTQGSYPCDATDDQAWSRAVVVSRHSIVQRISQAGQGGTQTTTPVDSAYGYTYTLNYPLTGQECGDCVAGMYWGSQNDGDYLDYYNGIFMGFAKAGVSNPDGSTEVHIYYSGHGWGVYDTSKVSCNGSNLTPIVTTCQRDPWADLANAAHGRETEADYYDTNGTTLLKTVTSAYTDTCPPSGVTGDGSTWDGYLVAEVDASNPQMVCDVQMTNQTTKMFDGGSSTTQAATTYSYDTYGPLTKTVTTSNGGTPSTVVSNTGYVWNDGVNPTSGSNTVLAVSGTYIVDLSAFTDVEDGSGNRATCHYVGYDGAGYQLGQQGTITHGLVTTDNKYTSCGTSPNWTPSGLLQTSATYDTYGNPQASKDPEANNGNGSHVGCTVGSTTYTECEAYDSHQANPTTSTNALNQAAAQTYANTAAGGWGLWPVSLTDANNNTTTLSYDVLGRMVGMVLPGEGSGLMTASMSYTNWCAATGAQTPCVEEDSTQRLDSGTTVTTRTFYDGVHRPVETRTAAPGNQDVVQYTFYDTLGRAVTSSSKYFVPAYTGGPGAAAYSLPDSTVTVTTVNQYDGLDRTLSTTDPLSETTTTSYSVVCGPVSGDSGCYEQALVTDANSHQTGTLANALGHTGYAQHYSGTGPYTLYSTTSTSYDVRGLPVTTTYPTGSTATASYDAAGRETASSDPDLGSYTYGYDANGNLTSSADPRGAQGTYYVCYDGLNRKASVQTGNSCSNPAGVLASYSYDSGTNGKGMLTGESFTSNGVSGSYAYSYDARGQKTGWTMTLGGTPYAFSFGYNDAGMPLTVTYPDGDTLTAGYTPQGWPSSMTEQLGTTTNPLVSNLAYTGIGGANGEPTSASVGLNLYTYSTGYDGLARATSSSVTRVSDSATLFSQSRTFDNGGNVSATSTTLPAGTDNQAFCYDEQNRLTWAGSTGTPSCGASLTPGSLSAANYTQSYSYDTLNRLTSGPAGSSYAYNDSNHLDAVTSTGSGYTAGYDQAGDMSCRAVTTSQTCSGTPTGQGMAYDALRRLTQWQDQTTNPNTVATYADDGEGQRVQQSVTSGGSTTTTQYIGGYEDITTTGGTTTTTKYYSAGVAQVLDTEEMTMRYLIIIEQANQNYSAYCPDLPGVIAVGDTIEETKHNMSEAIAFHIQGMLEDGEPIPQPSDAEWIDVPLAS